MAAIRSTQELVERARSRGPVRVVVPAAESETAVAAVLEAARQGLAAPVLIGDAGRVSRLVVELGGDPADVEILDEPDDGAAARRAVALVRAGQARLILKGRLHTAELMRAVLDRQAGLRNGRLLSDVLVSEHPQAPRLVGVSDGGVNVAPDLAQKKAILENAVRVFRRLGVERPKVAVLCAVETVERSQPQTGDARALAEMAERGEISGCDVVGPIALDGALAVQAAQAKHLSGPVAGRADILLVQSIEVGNVLGKAFTWLCGKPVAHVIEGASAPVLIPSRAEAAGDKLCSIALGVLASGPEGEP
jgi:phosphate butyryltransferase